MLKTQLPTIELLRKLLVCDAEAGLLWWRERPVEMFVGSKRPAEVMCRGWNTRLSGKPALDTDDGSGYLHGNILNKNYKAHRVIWAMHYGEWPTNQIDHKDGVKNNNRIKNLLDVSTQENLRNQRIRSSNTSGVCGVHWDKRSGKWLARIGVDYKQKYLGCFDKIEDAFSARKSAELRFGFSPNHGRK